MKINYWQNFESDCFYHIYNRAVGNDLIFREKSECQDFINKYQKYLHPYLNLYAYCLMPNHFHFIVQVKSEAEILQSLESENTSTSNRFKTKNATLNQLIGDQMRRMFSSISIKYNNKYIRKGPLFTPRTKRVFIENDDRLRYLINYVHHNPIHHGYSKSYDDWKWSSYNGLVSEKETLLKRQEVLELFGGGDKYNDFHRQFRIMKRADEIDNDVAI